MTIKTMPMGPYQTNCYIVSKDGKDFIIDPGVDALKWIEKNTSNPKAILNTHGHFDHVWSNQEVKENLDIPIYCPKGDCFMLQNDPFKYGTPPSDADIEVTPDQKITIDEVEFTFHHFPGHTPGCSAIAVENSLFSGDFIFQGSIGRVDFPFSNPEDMIKSIHKVLAWSDDYVVYPGHGDKTSLLKERSSLKQWLSYL